MAQKARGGASEFSLVFHMNAELRLYERERSKPPFLFGPKERRETIHVVGRRLREEAPDTSRLPYLLSASHLGLSRQ
jgi:hypothetical protein